MILRFLAAVGVGLVIDGIARHFGTSFNAGWDGGVAAGAIGINVLNWPESK